MILFNIVFVSGYETQEYGDSVQDVMQFINRCLSNRGDVKSITPA